MQVVGVDFGTTNVRIASWDSEQDVPPQSKYIGFSENPTVMPSAVALQRQANGEVSIIVGEDAEDLENEPADTTLVVPIIKRFAMSKDSYVRWHLDYRSAHQREEDWPPVWWNAETQSVEWWGQSFSVWKLIQSVIAEAFQRAAITGDYEWRAGCPVQSDFSYRQGLAQVLTQVTGKGNTNWIVEEPILFLIAARKLGDLQDGSYLIYDIGGGSFDCALIDLSEQNQQMQIYGAGGHPLLGGTDIDQRLINKVGYSGLPKVLRKAKEDRTESSPSETLGDGTVITLADVESVLQEGGFAEKSVSVLRDSYIWAKTLWKRSYDGTDDEHPPMGEITYRNSSTGEVRFVWQLTWDDLANEVDNIILFGGPTKSPYFKRYLETRFGTGKVILAEDLLEGVEEAALTGASVGACYSYKQPEPDLKTAEREYTSLYVNRLPVRITLEDLQTGEKVEYEPYDHFTDSPQIPLDVFVSRDSLRENPDDPHSDARYELIVATPDNVLVPTVGRDGILRERQPVDPYINTRLVGSALQLAIDRLGRVAVIQQSETSTPKFEVVIEQAPWQTESQRKIVAGKLSEQREYERRQQVSRGRLVGYVVDTRTGVVVRGIYENE